MQEPQSLHKYAYCHQNPVNGIDPSGEFTKVELLVVISIVAILATMLVFNVANYYSGYYTNSKAVTEEPMSKYIMEEAEKYDIEPRFLAAIIATEMQDRDAKDVFGDLPLMLFFDTSIGVGQVRTSTAAEMLNTGRIRGAIRAMNIRTNIGIAAKYISLLRKSAIEIFNKDKNFKFIYFEALPPTGVYEMSLKDFDKPMKTWSAQQKKLLAQQYTQTPWVFWDAPKGRKKAALYPAAAAYYDGFWDNYTNEDFKKAFK